MVLSKRDGELFYKLWLPLLDFVNDKYEVNINVKHMASAETLNPQDVKEIADKMWNDVEVIDEYIAEHSDAIIKEHKEIINSWKRRVQGEFVLERHLSKGSIFVSMDDEQVYQVSGIISSWKEMFEYAPMPIAMNATFIPFKDVIISDGLVMPYNVIIGPSMKRGFKDIYMRTKQMKTIHKSL